MNVETVSIKIQSGVYGQFRNLNNKVWFALGEYVDNAVQSFVNNREALKKIHNGEYQFEVRINIDWEQRQIVIHDNAAGIDTNNFKRAFEPANIPIDNSGLHEFGMGMKTASIWLANFWSVRTAALSETEERYVEFDLQKVLDEDREVLRVKNIPKENSSHFTEIKLSQLSSNAPSIMQVDKIKRHLGSIYRKFIRDGDLKLYINDVELTYEDPEILIAPHYSDPTGPPILWKKEIEFSSGKYSVKGFIGILATMSTNEANGLSLFRRGRVIEGSHNEKYRPKVICGQVGSPRFKRIFGELELKGFAVSFNKGSFQEQDDLISLMEALKEEISAKDFDLYTQAEKYIKPKTQNDNEKIAKRIIKRINKTIDVVNSNEKMEAALGEIQNNGVFLNNEELSKGAIGIGNFEEKIQLQGKEYHLILEFINEPEIHYLYTLHEETDDASYKKVLYKINLAHSFFIRFDNFRTDDGYMPIQSFIRTLVLAELLSPLKGTRSAGNVRLLFNQLLNNY